MTFVRIRLRGPDQFRILVQGSSESGLGFKIRIQGLNFYFIYKIPGSNKKQLGSGFNEHGSETRAKRPGYRWCAGNLSRIR